MVMSIAACRPAYEDASLKEVVDVLIEKNMGLCDASTPEGAVVIEVVPVLQMMPELQ
jgi:hypothetical protein